jgi:hypothetical protein
MANTNNPDHWQTVRAQFEWLQSMASDDPIPIISDAGWPMVACPGCGVSMRPTEKRRITPSTGMVMVTYICEQCQFETFRMVKDE